MSEHTPQHHESQEADNSAEAHVEHAKTAEHNRLRLEQAAKAAAETQPSVEAAQERVETEATSAEQTVIEHEQQPAAGSPNFVSRELKKTARARQLKHVREHLPKGERALSRVIHQPIIDSISEVSGKTIARPSGLLAGGICAFLGSSIFLYIAKHNGYRYNFLIWAMFFVGGFVVGLIVEALLAIARRVKS